MSETPTARELLSHLRGGDLSPCDNPHHVEWLASRVEAVLKACKSPGGIDAWDFCRRVERILDGGEP